MVIAMMVLLYLSIGTCISIEFFDHPIEEWAKLSKSDFQFLFLFIKYAALWPFYLPKLYRLIHKNKRR